MTTLPTLTTTVKLLAASQPDIVRASQKDETYIEQYVEATREVVRRLAGPFRALQYARESKLLALLLYHGLTTGLGQPTLGEEYCAMQQVAGDGHLPGPHRRLLLALLLSVGPYVTDRLAAQLDSAAEEEVEAAGAVAGDEDAPNATAATAAAADLPSFDLGSERESLDQGERRGWADEVEREVEGEPRRASGGQAGGGPGTAAAAAASGSQQRTRRGGGGGGARPWLRLLAAAVVARWSRSWRALVLAWPRLRPLLSYAGRLHLALFYAYGAYYSLAHRLAGIRYSLSMRPLQGRPSYRVLGALLGLQLAVVAALQARAALRNIRRHSAVTAAAAKRRGLRGRAGEGEGGEEHLFAGEDEPAVFLEDYDDDVSPDDIEGDGAAKAAAISGPDAAAVEGEAAAAAVAHGAVGEGGGEGGSNGGGGGGAGSGMVVEGWEEVERLDEASGLGWEADVFGIKASPPAPPAPPPQQHQQRPQQQQGHVADKLAKDIASGGAATAVASASSRASQPAAGDAHARRHGGTSSGVLPVLTSLRQCPLCLSPKSHPTSTPCGHTFCWGCITTWCVEKPECPLCRSAVRLPQLVALYHTNC